MAGVLVDAGPGARKKAKKQTKKGSSSSSGPSLDVMPRKEETLPLDLTGKLKKGFWARVGPVTKKKKKDLLREEEDQEEAEEEEWDELNGSGKRLALWKRLDKKQQLRNYAAFRLRLEYLDDYVERTFYSQQQLLRQQLRSEDSSRSLRQKNRAAKKNDTITTRSSTNASPKTISNSNGGLRGSSGPEELGLSTGMQDIEGKSTDNNLVQEGQAQEEEEENEIEGIIRIVSSSSQEIESRVMEDEYLALSITKQIQEQTKLQKTLAHILRQRVKQNANASHFAMISGPTLPVPFRVEENRTLLGRITHSQRLADVHVSDDKIVSHVHCAIVFSKERQTYFVENLSPNGLMVSYPDHTSSKCFPLTKVGAKCWLPNPCVIHMPCTLPKSLPIQNRELFLEGKKPLLFRSKSAACVITFQAFFVADLLEMRSLVPGSAYTHVELPEPIEPDYEALCAPALEAEEVANGSKSKKGGNKGHEEAAEDPKKAKARPRSRNTDPKNTTKEAETKSADGSQREDSLTDSTGSMVDSSSQETETPSTPQKRKQPQQKTPKSHPPDPTTTYRFMIEEALTSFGGKATQKEIADFVSAKHPEVMNKKTWRNSISGILSTSKSFATEPVVLESGKRARFSLWVLVDKDQRKFNIKPRGTRRNNAANAVASSSLGTEVSTGDSFVEKDPISDAENDDGDGDADVEDEESLSLDIVDHPEAPPEKRQKTEDDPSSSL